MIKLLYSTSCLMLLCAGLVLVLCGISSFPHFLQSRGDEEISIIEKFRKQKGETQSNKDRPFPLVQNAAEYTLYLNPVISSDSHTSSEKITNTRPAQQFRRITPRFKLLSTSYYLSTPEKSLALISMPGRDAAWMAKGERFGNFVIERVENGVITYRDGNSIYKMSVSPVEAAQTFQVQNPIELPLDEEPETPPVSSSPKSNITRMRVINTSESSKYIYKE
jgi:hypothetical protein